MRKKILAVRIMQKHQKIFPLAITVENCGSHIVYVPAAVITEVEP